MKICLRVALLLVALTAMASANNIKVIDQPHNQLNFLGHVPDRFIVVTKTQVPVPNAEMKGQVPAHVGVKSLDALADRFAVRKWQRQFAGSERKAGPIANELARHYKVTISEGSLVQAMDAYRNDPNVERVEPIGIHAMFATPNDTYFDPYQWYHAQSSDHDIDSPEAWDIETGSDATIVAILDSGTRYYHRDLGGLNASPSNPGASRGNMWINDTELNGSAGVDDDGNGYVDDWIGYDFVESTTNCWSGEDCDTKDNDPRDFNGHGTHTAGIVGMITNDGFGMAGVAGGWGNGSQQEYANGVRIMPLRMGYSYNYLGQEYGVVLMDAAAEAFYYAADNGADIASCSWGSSNSGGISSAATYFLNNGGLIFVAAGNGGTEESPDYLNGRGDCISVSATNEQDDGASFTTYGTWVDICAPGDNIYSTYHDHNDPNTDYWASLGGTSMATPMTAGVAALIWSQNPTWSASQVTNQLYSSTDNIDAYLSSKYIGKMGVGRINAFNAVNTGTPPPVADFSGSPTSGCAPLTVNFTNLSTGDITSYDWDFGDGGTSTATNPSHQYSSPGTYTVSLTATGPGGSDTETKTNYITVTGAPTADFSGSPTSGIEPLTVNFTDLSTGSPSSWDWDFGDGGTSTAQHPTHQYTSAGTYTVTLTATNSCGSDQEVKTDYITVNPCVAPVADFSGSPTSGEAPLMVSFTDLSSDATSWDWDFGDGGTSTAQHPAHTYNSAGTYTVTLTATNTCGSDQEIKADYVTVTEPTVDYATLPYSTGFESGSFDQYWFTQSSNSEGRIQITSSYTPRGSYHLTMDDNTNGSQYAQNEAWLRVNLSGYADVDLSFYWKEFSDESHSQDGVFFSDDGGGSFTKVYNLTGGSSSYSQINLDVDQLASSNGLSLTGTFVIKFQQYDNYSLTTDGQAFDDISVTASTPAPVAAFSGTPTSGCAPLDVTFTDESSGDITSWSWDFGDGSTSTSQNPSHTYNAAGTYTVELTVTGPGGSDTETKTDYITVSAPPTAEFNGSPTSGDYPLQVDFTDQSTGNPTSWSWDFGDGGTSASQNPSHTYNAAGTYTVELTVSNACGNDAETKVDYITVTEPPVAAVIGEVGVETRNQTGNGADWYTVNLNNSYTNPVVVMRGLTTNGGHKTHLRVRNVSGTSFEWQMEEWDYHDGNHTTEDCPYFVLEAGTHMLEDGTLIEAGTASIGTGFTTINFNQSFSSAPTLITGVASQNDAAAVITRTRNLGSSSFQIKLQEEEAADGVHANETVAWVAIGQGSGSNNGVSFEAGRTGNSVTHEWYSITFGSNVGSSPVFLCHDDTYDGGNTCGTRYRNLSGTSVEVFIEEEQSGDSEVSHITEVVSYVVWGAAGDIKAASGTAVASLDEDVQSPKRRTMIEPAAAVPTTYALHQNFPNPFNAGTNITYALVEGGHVRLDVYDVLGRRVRTLVDGYRPEGIHTIQFDARDQNGRELASGMYFYRVISDRFIDAKKMMLLK